MFARGCGGSGLVGNIAMLSVASDDRLGRGTQQNAAGALAWAELITASDQLRLVVEPSLDIVNFFAVTDGWQVSRINALTNRVFEALMNDQQHPVYLAKLNLKPQLAGHYPELVWDAPTLTVLRSVLMKPEHLAYVPTLHERVLAALT